MSQPRPASRKKKVFLINFGDDYRTVIFGKTNFRWFAARDLLVRQQHSICCKSRRSVAAARSTQTAAIPLQQTPNAFGAVSPAGTALSLQNRNEWQDKFFIF